MNQLNTAEACKYEIKVAQKEPEPVILVYERLIYIYLNSSILFAKHFYYKHT